MAKYLVRRILQIIPVLIIISMIVFLLVNVTGDPTSTMLPPTASDEERDVLREALGLNEPLTTQYRIFITTPSTATSVPPTVIGLPASELAIQRIPASVQLAGVSLLFSILIAIPLGILSAQFRNSPFDLIISGISALGRAMPGFWGGHYADSAAGSAASDFPGFRPGHHHESDIAGTDAVLRNLSHHYPADSFQYAGHHASGLHPHRPQQGPA